MDKQSHLNNTSANRAGTVISQQTKERVFAPDIAKALDQEKNQQNGQNLEMKSESTKKDTEDTTDIDSCIDCGGFTTIGVIGCHSGGGIYHKHYCNKCYYKMKMHDEDRPKKKKDVPSKIEKEFMNAGLRVSKRNAGTQLVVSKKFTRVDFWPTTLRWYNRNTGESGVGKEGVFHSFGL